MDIRVSIPCDLPRSYYCYPRAWIVGLLLLLFFAESSMILRLAKWVLLLTEERKFKKSHYFFIPETVIHDPTSSYIQFKIFISKCVLFYLQFSSFFQQLWVMHFFFFPLSDEWDEERCTWQLVFWYVGTL